MTEDQRILHVLNRLGYGPRPGDLERVKRMGLAAYIERQLDPGSIPDSTTDQALAEYRTLTLSAAVLVHEYPRLPPEVQRKSASGEMSPRDVAEAYPPERRAYRILTEMQAAKLTRAVLSERQLEEVMVDFWLNHFNVFAHKGPIVWMLPSYERDAIRPHALGRFRDLVAATARHPAMLFYLDNWTNVRRDTMIMQGPNRGRMGGLNENYARELMELHTLGVDGGYSQEDVIEVARCFTGWSIDRPQQGGGFVFRPRAHDRDAKRVLGNVVPAGGGEQDGMRVIDLLARQPSTARFVSTKLVRRFVSDDPPRALVDRAAATFLQSDGDIRAVLVTIFLSDEFFSAQAYHAKIKTPLEAVASATRAVGARVAPSPSPTGALSGGAISLARQVAKLGEPLYESQPPTGYPDRAEAWVNTGALLGRMNFALALAQNRLSGVRVDLGPAVATADRSQPEQVLDRLIAATLNGEVSAQTRAILMAQLESPEITRVRDYDSVPRSTDVEKLAALVLGSPEFQRR
ncbi:MAG TPA: DUF1800 domain-containing protein [Candidatus Methylomirabilis sp.]|nr:DUF1800 domain-containing protein [Candidatus Methylomirabilis sp.]